MLKLAKFVGSTQECGPSKRVIWAWPPPVSGGALRPAPAQYHLSSLIMSSVNHKLYITAESLYILIYSVLSPFSVYETVVHNS